MIHIIAIVSLAVACMVWFVLQRFTGRLEGGCSGSGGCGGEKKGNCLFCGGSEQPHEH